MLQASKGGSKRNATQQNNQYTNGRTVTKDNVEIIKRIAHRLIIVELSVDVTGRLNYKQTRSVNLSLKHSETI